MSAMERTTYRTTSRRSPGSRAFNEPRRNPPHTPSTPGASTDFSSDDSIPLFLSDPQGQPDPQEFAPSAPSQRTSMLAWVAAGGLVVSAFAILVGVGMFNSNVTRALVDKTTAPTRGATENQAPTSGATENQSAMQAASAQPAVREIPPKDPDLVSEPATLATVNANPPREETPNHETPGREAIISAHDSAPQSQAPAAPARNEAPAKTLDAETLAALMTRAKSMLALGDIAAARLLLERAANARDAAAAFLLAQTYDPAVLGVQDVRSTTANPAMARDWYRTAASLGSADAQQRLTQLQN